MGDQSLSVSQPGVFFLLNTSHCFIRVYVAGDLSESRCCCTHSFVWHEKAAKALIVGG